MGLTQFDIVLDNPHRSYFAGQIVSGKVIVSLDRPKKIHGVKLKLLGKAKTHWKESSGRTTTTASDEEDYIDEKVYLFGYEADGSESILPAGDHSYSFYFTLPLKIPSSFESRYGSVKYSLTAVMSRSLKSNFTVKIFFTVNGIFDLNEEWGAQHVGELHKSKSVCCLCCKSGPISFNLRLPRVGYVPGDNIPFTAEIINHSLRKVHTTSLSLIQNLTFRAGTKTKRKSIVIHVIEGPECEPGQEEIWKSHENSPPPLPGANQTWRLESEFIRIPPIPPTRLGGCRIIDAQYSIKIKLEIEDATCLRGHIPIVIGTIPLRSPSSPERYLDLASRTQLPEEEQRSTSSIPGYPDLLPPSYEECVLYHQLPDSDEDAEADTTKPPDYNAVAFGGSEKFIPRYATYSQQPVVSSSASDLTK